MLVLRRPSNPSSTLLLHLDNVMPTTRLGQASSFVSAMSLASPVTRCLDY